MKSIRNNFWIAALFVSVLHFGCEEVSNDPGPTQQTSNPVPTTTSDTNLVLASIKVKANPPVGVPNSRN